ncbi:unnamed protein product [Closterium sp. NIES-54]
MQCTLAGAYDLGDRPVFVQPVAAALDFDAASDSAANTTTVVTAATLLAATRVPSSPGRVVNGSTNQSSMSPFIHPSPISPLSPGTCPATSSLGPSIQPLPTWHDWSHCECHHATLASPMPTALTAMHSCSISSHRDSLAAVTAAGAAAASTSTFAATTTTAFTATMHFCHDQSSFYAYSTWPTQSAIWTGGFNTLCPLLVHVSIHPSIPHFPLAFRDLSCNQLSGHIPPSLSSLTRLVTLSLSDNQLNGLIPSAITSLKNLETLDLSHNQLSGPIPPSLSSLARLVTLGLSHNQISGPIPTFLNSLTSLITL